MEKMRRSFVAKVRNAGKNKHILEIKVHILVMGHRMMSQCAGNLATC